MIIVCFYTDIVSDNSCQKQFPFYQRQLSDTILTEPKPKRRGHMLKKARLIDVSSEEQWSECTQKRGS